MREFALIEQLRRRFGRAGPSVAMGIGDDAAVLTPPRGRQLVMTTDLLIEGIHFDRRTASCEEIGYKAAIANLSDLAAMGARPEYALVSLACPSTCSASDVHRLYKGMMDACRTWHVALIGGDTSASLRGLFLSLTLTGSVPSGRALLRSGARAGDRLYVTGTLGDALAGLQLLSRTRREAARVPSSSRRFLIDRHRRPTAHPRFGQLLTAHRLATAAIDLSDGISGDLRHLCEQSHVGVELDATALPISLALRVYARASRIDPLALALQGGEDYELLFTVPPSKERALARAARRTGRMLTRIGVIRPRAFGLRLRDLSGRLRPLPAASYEHFRSGNTD